jgi:hypothetical protein
MEITFREGDILQIGDERFAVAIGRDKVVTLVHGRTGESPASMLRRAQEVRDRRDRFANVECHTKSVIRDLLDKRRDKGKDARTGVEQPGSSQGS